MKKNFLLYTVVFWGAILFDRITKGLALYILNDTSVSLFPGLNVHFVWNRGVSWGMFSNSTQIGFWVLTTIIALVIFIFSAYTVLEYKHGVTIGFELLVLAGAVSNFFDRIVYGAVIDFIDCYVGTWHWPTFNVADMCIVIGIGGVIIRGLLCEQQKN